MTLELSEWNTLLVEALYHGGMVMHNFIGSVFEYNKLISVTELMLLLMLLYFS
jgi:hypothetical protein